MVKEILNKIDDLRFHREMLCYIYENLGDLESKREIVEVNKRIRELEAALACEYYRQLKEANPGVDVIYEEKIISFLGIKSFALLKSQGKIQLCACINGRRLYAM